MISSLAKVIKASDFAARKHRFQKRKDRDQTPYINHPIGVANIIIQEGGVEDADVIQAALLHDTIEDTETTFEELVGEFGAKVAGIVRELTDDKTKEKNERKRLQIEHAASKSWEAKVVGMGDKIYNLRDLERSLPVGWSEERRAEYFVWAKRVVVNYYDANEKLAQVLEDVFNRNGK